jgi:hypothetical protein
MKENQQRQLDALRRVKGFITVHAAALGGIIELEGRKEVDSAITAVDDFINQQAAASRFISAQQDLQQRLVQQLMREHLTPVARFARAKLGTSADYKALAPAITQQRGSLLLSTARAMATAVAKNADAYTTGGFPADQAQQIVQLVEQIMATQAERATLRGGRVNATRGITVQINKGMAGLKHLDAIIIKQYASNPGFLAEWRSASRVWDKLGVTRKLEETPAEPAAV